MPVTISDIRPRVACDALSALDCIEGDLDVLSGVDTATLSGTDALAIAARAAAAIARLTGIRAAALTQVEASGAWALDGSRSMPWALARNEEASVSTLRAEITFAQRLATDLPLIAAALRAGEITLDKARLIVRLAPTSPARRQALKDSVCGEAFLLAQAKRLDMWGLTRALRYWGYRVDPDIDDANYRDDAHRYELQLADTLDGTAVKGFLSPEGGLLLRAALGAIIGVPDKADLRTTGQRNADALTTLARTLLDAGEHSPGAGVRPHLNVTVPFETLVAAAGETGIDPAVFTETGLPIPKVLLERIACDCDMSRVIFDSDGIVLDAGRTRRIVSNDQRRAVITRDQQCQRPQCHAPPRYCEVHHRIWWERGGVTSVADSVLLCFRCHDWVHREDIAITRVGDHWEFTDPSGRLIT